MKRFLAHTGAKIGRFFWSWRFLKFILWTVTLIVLFYVEEDWRGACAWTATKAGWEAKGETFDPDKFVPAPIPDNENLAALPIFKVEPDPKENGARGPLKLMQALDEETDGDDLPRVNATPDELRVGLAKAYARAFPGATPPAEMLAQFEALYPVIPEIRAAARARPSCRFNLDYDVQPPMFRSFNLLTGQIRLSQRLCLHAVIALEDNQPVVALEDIRLNWRLASAAGRDPTLVAGLVDIGITAITSEEVENGLVRHAWNDAQLADLQSELGRIDFLAQYRFTLRGELVTGSIPNLDYVKILRGKEWNPSHGAMRDLWPGGWIDLTKSKVIDLVLPELKTIDPQSRRVYPDVTRQVERDTEQAEALPWRLAPWNLMVGISAPDFTKLAMKFAVTQVWRIDEARIACGLERYRLAHGAYPAWLDPLAPAYIDELPHDIMNGKPYHYQLRPDGTYLLYSVGWKQTDDGGKIVFEKENPDRIDYTKGDWIWPTSEQHGP